MTTVTRLALTLLLAASAAVATARVAAAGPAEPQVPAEIAVPAGNKLFLIGHAEGVQIYRCAPTATGFAWSFVAPRATLYDDHGNVLMTHFAGPTWQAKDGSAVLGSVTGRATVDPAAVAWLRLETAPAADSKPGRIARTSFIQRLATTGGVAPAAATCTAATAGTAQEVPYTADYAFWKPHHD
jgi:hypothetical protein